MAMRHLGDRFDIHTGGEDNVFPHHEDEIAQSGPIVGGPPADLWVHGAFLMTSGRKMAKSAGNFQRVTELADDGIEALAFRYLCLTARYSRRLDYSDESLAAAATALTTLRSRLRALGQAPAGGPWAAPAALVAGRAADRPSGSAGGVRGHVLPDGEAEPEVADRAGSPAAPLSPGGRELHERFVAAIDDDLDLPTAVATIHATLRADLPADERRWLVLDADAVLGLDLHLVWRPQPPAAVLEPRVDALLAERVEARARRDWARADEIRERLRALGMEPVDLADGTTELRPVVPSKEA
jgi:cysteinyl-tRNA synthetase